MAEAQTHYELLGVSRTATAQEIRAAYLRLMKRYHPDAASDAGGAGRGADFVTVLNRCYAILRNPATRSQYDNQLQDAAGPALPELQRHSVRQRLQLMWPAILLASALALGIFARSLDPTFERDTRASGARAGDWIEFGAAPFPAPVQTALPDPAESRRMAQLARALPAKQAEQFSRRCFMASARQPQAGAGDACVLLDVAFLYWHKVPGSAAMPAYFADGVVDGRHREAVSEFGSAGESRLANLRQMALRALIQNVEEQRRATVTAELPPDSERELREIQKGERLRLAEAGPDRDVLEGGN